MKLWLTLGWRSRHDALGMTNEKYHSYNNVNCRTNVLTIYIEPWWFFAIEYYCWNKRRLHQVNVKRRSISVRDKYDGGPYCNLNGIVKQNSSSSMRYIALIEKLSSYNTIFYLSITTQGLRSERTIDSLAPNSTASIYRASLGDHFDKPHYQNQK